MLDSADHRVPSMRHRVSAEEWQARMSCGTKLREVPRDVVDATYRNCQRHVRRPFGVMEWPAMLRKLDRLDPSWRA